MIGFIELLIKKNDRIFKVRKYGYINSLTVDKKLRKKGIAKQLVDHAIKFFKDKKINYVRTNVYLSNKIAHKFWPKLGFKPESQFMLKKI